MWILKDIEKRKIWEILPSAVAVKRRHLVDQIFCIWLLPLSSSSRIVSRNADLQLKFFTVYIFLNSHAVERDFNFTADKIDRHMVFTKLVNMNWWWKMFAKTLETGPTAWGLIYLPVAIEAILLSAVSLLAILKSQHEKSWIEKRKSLSFSKFSFLSALLAMARRITVKLKKIFRNQSKFQSSKLWGGKGDFFRKKSENTFWNSFWFSVKWWFFRLLPTQIFEFMCRWYFYEHKTYKNCKNNQISSWLILFLWCILLTLWRLMFIFDIFWGFFWNFA